MFGPSSSVVLELRRIISNQKWANASLVLRYIGLGWFIIMDIFCESSSILQSSRQRHLNIQLERKQLWQQRRKMPCYNLHRRWNLSINVRDRDLLLVSLYLRFQFFRICIFLLFVILAGPHFAMSHLLIIMNLFCLISCQFQRIRNFHKIGSHFGTMTWADDMQQCDNNINQGI